MPSIAESVFAASCCRPSVMSFFVQSLFHSASEKSGYDHIFHFGHLWSQTQKLQEGCGCHLPSVPSQRPALETSAYDGVLHFGKFIYYSSQIWSYTRNLQEGATCPGLESRAAATKMKDRGSLFTHLLSYTFSHNIFILFGPSQFIIENLLLISWNLNLCPPKSLLSNYPSHFKISF